MLEKRLYNVGDAPLLWAGQDNKSFAKCHHIYHSVKTVMLHFEGLWEYYRL